MSIISALPVLCGMGIMVFARGYTEKYLGALLVIVGLLLSGWTS